MQTYYKIGGYVNKNTTFFKQTPYKFDQLVRNIEFIIQTCLRRKAIWLKGILWGV